MKITDGEKIILLMLSEMYEKLNITGEIDPEFIRSSIFSNNIWAIPWRYSGVPFEDQEDPKIVIEIMDILDMWSSIEHSYENLTGEEKTKLANLAHPFGNNPKFPGFDGNNESEYMGKASFIVNELQRFEEFSGRDFNSHGPSIDSYRRMLSKFEIIRKELHFGPMRVDDLVILLKERIHPSMR